MKMEDKPLQGRVICVDPGHPSEVGRGTSGRAISEIQVAWRVGQFLQKALEMDGARVILTKRQEGQMVRNRARAEIANAARADLMVRLHCDSDAGSGFASYYPSRAGVAADGRRGPSAAVLTACRSVAPRFHAAFAKKMAGTPLRDRGLLTDLATAVGGKQGALTGSIYSEVPVVLVEMCVLTNPRDEAFVRTESGQKRLADALAAGVRAAILP